MIAELKEGATSVEEVGEARRGKQLIWEFPKIGDPNIVP